MNTSKMAAPELAEVKVQGITRESFIARGAIAAGSVYGLQAVGPFVRQALAQGGGGDVEVLNFALTLEFLEATYYEQALDQVSGLSGKVKRVATEIRDNENEHVSSLTNSVKQAGGEPAKAPQVDFGRAFRSERTFLELAQTFEDTGVSAYNGAAPQIESKEVLSAAGSIVQVEARHAGLIRFIRGEDISEAFDKALEMNKVLEAVQPFIKS